MRVADRLGVRQGRLDKRTSTTREHHITENLPAEQGVLIAG